MEPTTTAALIGGLVSLGTAALTPAATKLGEAGLAKAREYWSKAKGVLGFAADPPPEKLEDAIGAAVYARPDLRPQLETLLAEYKQASGTALVGSIDVNQGTVTVVGTNTGNITNTNTFKGK